MSRFKSLFTGAESTTRPRKNSASSVESVPSRKNSLSSPPPQQRFVVYEDSTHAHHLKSARRQEKLSGMLRELIGTKKRDEAVSAVPGLLKENNDVVGVGGGGAAAAGGGPPTSGSSSETTPSTPPSQPQPPSLLSGLVSQIRKGDTEAATESVLRQVDHSSESFVRKYGKCQEVIGRGSFGIVRVAHKTDGQLYAVKEFKKRPQESDKEYNRRLTSEFCISSSLHHPNIIHTLDLLHDAKGEYCEVMEFCSGGDLYSLILAAGKLEFLEADCFFKQILLGVNYMHQMGVAHRDLKPENILLTANGAVKITDFGNGECFRMAWEKEIHLSRGLCGSTPYIAPEEYGDEVFDPRPVDIWALGVIYMAMRTGRHLWTIARPADDEFYDRYLKGRKSEKGYEPIESLKRARCRNVIYSILDPVPSRRITGKQILKSEWGREIYVCQAGTSGI